MRIFSSGLACYGMGLTLVGLTGCQTDSFVDPSVTGRWEHQPTTLPILRRIHAIEIGEQIVGETPSREDLIANDFSDYRIVPGDVVTVTAFDVYQPGQPVTVDRVVDQSGYVQLPEIGLVEVQGLLPEELNPSVRAAYGRLLGAPQVDAALVQRTGFRFTVNGFIAQPNVYPLVRSDLRLLEALSQAGGILDNARYAVVRRRVQLDEPIESEPEFDRSVPLDLDGLLDRLEGGAGAAIGATEDTFIDVDALTESTLPEVQTPNEIGASPWRWDTSSGAWQKLGASQHLAGVVQDESPVFIDRVLRIPLQELRRGDSSLDIVVRPGDSILVERVGDGNIYIDGEIARPGPYGIPLNEPYFTLSRAITSAGGLGPLAEPDKVDLRRIVGQDREAIIRLDLAGIRNGTEPDVVLRPSDQIIVGTGFWNRPMFILREGLRSNYGFSLRLDRNFGNDVFGFPSDS
ncbi:MAG: hypothetical protein CMJ28_05450 [Phycisphaerae bacterium]|nr:hypothetical protein [Phycisphaerae bacterium]